MRTRPSQHRTSTTGLLAVAVLILLTTSWLHSRLVAPFDQAITAVNASRSTLLVLVLVGAAGWLLTLSLVVLRWRSGGAPATDDGSGSRDRRFMDDVAHQLRTPLATIRSSVEALFREDDPAVRERLEAGVLRESARAEQVLGALLTLARLDERTPSAAAVATDLVALCLDEVGRQQSLAPGLTVRCEATDLVTGTWLLDPAGTREILANLLDNARRHARSLIVVRPALVHDGPATATIELQVRDDGPGVPPEFEAQLFTRFAALDGLGGSGLGLAIARALARAQGGDVIHRGAAFVVRLPARAVADLARPSDAAPV
jgi:signal transduction histidine kinase